MSSQKGKEISPGSSKTCLEFCPDGGGKEEGSFVFWETLAKIQQHCISNNGKTVTTHIHDKNPIHVNKTTHLNTC